MLAPGSVKQVGMACSFLWLLQEQGLTQEGLEGAPCVSLSECVCACAHVFVHHVLSIHFPSLPAAVNPPTGAPALTLQPDLLWVQKS